MAAILQSAIFDGIAGANYGSTTPRLRGFDFKLEVGPYPSVCLMRYIVIDNLALRSTTGTLTIQQQDDAGLHTANFYNCAVDNSEVVRHQRGELEVVIKDRRVWWQSARITGTYNVPASDGDLKPNPNEKKTVTELFALLLDAVGETGYDLTEVPDVPVAGPYPQVQWDHDLVVDQLEWLGDLVACDVVLGLDDVVRVKSRDAGVLPDSGGRLPLPTSGLRHAQRTIQVRAVPRQYKVVGEPIIWQSKFELEPVGQETDGTIKPFDDLSYRPNVPGDWKTEWSSYFGNVVASGGNTALENRRLALLSCYRWYRIRGLARPASANGLEPTNFPTSTYPTPSSIRQLRPVSRTLLEDEATFETLSGRTYVHPEVSRVEGRFWAGGSDYQNTADHSLYLGSWSYDNENQMVIFDKPVIRWGTAAESTEVENKPLPALLYLTTSHETRLINEDGPPVRYEVFGNVLNQNSSEPEVIRVPGLRRTIISTYNGTNLLGVFDNFISVDTEAQLYIAEAEAVARDQQETYAAGFVLDQELGGLLTEVHWTKPPNRIGHTRFKRRI